MRPVPTNYAKSISFTPRQIRYWSFDDRRAEQVAKAKQWLANEEAMGRQVSIYRRPIGLARGYLDAIPVIGDFEGTQEPR